MNRGRRAETLASTAFGVADLENSHGTRLGSYWFCLCNSATCFSRGSHDAFWIRPQTTAITARVVFFRREPIKKETVLRSVGTFKPAKPIVFEQQHGTNFRYSFQRRFRFCSGINLSVRWLAADHYACNDASKIISDDYNGYTTTVRRRRRTSQHTMHLTNTHICAYIVYDRFHFSIPIVYRVYFFLWKPTLIGRN